MTTRVVITHTFLTAPCDSWMTTRVVITHTFLAAHCDSWMTTRVVITQTFLTAPFKSRQQGLLSPRPSSLLLVTQDNKGWYHPDLPHCSLWLKTTRVVITQTFLTAPCDSRQQGLLSPRPSSLLLVTQDNKGCYHPDLPHCSLWLKTTRVVITQTFLTAHSDSWMTTRVVITQTFLTAPFKSRQQGLLSPRPSSLLLVTQDNKSCNLLDLPHCDWKQQRTTFVVFSHSEEGLGGFFHPDLPHCSLWLKTARADITQTFLSVIENKGCYHPDLLTVTQDSEGCYHPDLTHCSLWLETTRVVTSTTQTFPTAFFDSRHWESKHMKG